MVAKTAKKIGASGEDQALAYLLRHGYKLVARNWSCKLGEVDLIMEKNNVRVFVEVRTRAQTTFGAGADTVSYQKQAKLLRTTRFYQQKEDYWGDLRFDVVAIETKSGGTGRIEHIEHAFMAGR